MSPLRSSTRLEFCDVEGAGLTSSSGETNYRALACLLGQFDNTFRKVVGLGFGADASVFFRSIGAIFLAWIWVSTR